MATVTIPNRPAGSDVRSIEAVLANFDAITNFLNGANLDAANLVPELALTLPASPIDGQSVSFLADAANGVVWRLRYRSGASGAFKWEFVGGSALFSEVTTGESCVSTSYVDLTTVGPRITLPTLPNGGDFEVTTGFTQGSNVGDTAFMSYSIGGSGANDNDSAYSTAQAGGGGASVTRTRRKTALGSGTVLTSKYRNGSLTSAQAFLYRFIRVVPVRVG